MSAAAYQRLFSAGLALAQASHGERDMIIASCCRDLDISRPTFYRRIKAVMGQNERKRRTDRGETALTRDEALLISAYIREHMRRNGKRLVRIADALDILRANGRITAGRVDADSGEIRFLSASAVDRALRLYRMHPDQLAQPKPAQRLASKHPNHVWQMDASLCVLFYLPDPDKEGRRSLKALDPVMFNDNKPDNLRKIENNRVWRFVITDHTSGWIFVRYAFGGESSKNVVDTFIQAIQPRECDPVYGVPRILMLDPGAANKAAPLKNLCAALGMRQIINEVGNARAKGSVEKANDIVECRFESMLRLAEIHNIEQLNAEVRDWQRKFNASVQHSRHGKTRYEAWVRITQDQLIIPPAVEVCQAVAYEKPDTRIVSDFLTVSFGGHDYDVSDLPNVLVREKITVCRNPWRNDAIQVISIDADGREQFFAAQRVEKDQYGFALGAAMIGETYKTHADTLAVRHAKDIEMAVTGTDSLESATQARKSKGVLQQGALAGIDPRKPLADIPQPTWLPKRGTALEGLPMVPAFEPVRESVIDVLMRLKRALGEGFDPSIRIFLENKYPDGLSSEEADTVVAQALTGPTKRKEIAL